MPKNSLKFKIIPIIALLLFACKKHDNDFYRNKIEKQYPEIKNGKWEIFFKTEDEDVKIYQQCLKKADTVYTLNISIFSETTMEEFNYKNRYSFELYKKYSDSLYKYELLIINNDTAYFFKTQLNNPNNRIFIIGKEDSYF